MAQQHFPFFKFMDWPKKKDKKNKQKKISFWSLFETADLSKDGRHTTPKKKKEKKK